jgi:hypothetical protein
MDATYVLLDFLHQILRMVLEDPRGSKENDPRLTRSISIMTVLRQKFIRKYELCLDFCFISSSLFTNYTLFDLFSFTLMCAWNRHFEPNNFYQYEIQDIIRNDPSLLERLMKGTGIGGDEQILAFLFRRAPFLFDLDAKAFQFHHAYPMKHGDPDVYVVSREDILTSAIHAFEKRKRVDFRRPWKVQFRGEEHVLDIRGVRREFLTLLSEKIIEMEWFLETPSHDCYPNVSVKDANAFEFIGKLIAKVLLEEEHLKFRISAFVCKTFLSLPIVCLHASLPKEREIALASLTLCLITVSDHFACECVFRNFKI